MRVDILILHYTGTQTAQAAIDRQRDPAARVSCHYVVDEDGSVLNMVPEERRAWHAGTSYWRGHTGLNDRSISIQLVNPGHEWGYRDFPVLQLAAVCDLCLSILSRHPIPARNFVGHSDVAPDRAQDPGERFEWQALAQNGVGLWPGDMPDLGNGGMVRDAASLRDVRAALAARPGPGRGAASLPAPLAARGGDRPGRRGHTGAAPRGAAACRRARFCW